MKKKTQPIFATFLTEHPAEHLWKPVMQPRQKRKADAPEHYIVKMSHDKISA